VIYAYKGQGEEIVNIRFVSWNIHRKNHITPPVELLHRINADLIALQEITMSAYQELVAS